MLLDRNPTWHGLIDGEMPPYPAAIVQNVLARFEIENPAKLKAWPFGPFDIIAAFEYRNIPYLLKGRHIEQRGVKSLFQTQDIQKQLLQLGFPVSDFIANSSGETLVQGPDWQAEENIFYEIQTILPGVPFSPDTHTALLAGKLLGQLHLIGQEIHSDLLSKFYYIDTFVDRFPNRLQAVLQDGRSLQRGESQEIKDSISRLSDASTRSSLTHRLTHGDFTPDNLLMNQNQLFLIDNDELGFGVAAVDIAWGLTYLFGLNIGLGQIFLNEYRKHVPEFAESDLLAVKDYLIALNIHAYNVSELLDILHTLLSI
ncbi:MAG: phosphotransferase [Gemmatimonadetes bacterium]|nr:phosphotransferase [Gemmatimonadota bacterium]MYK53075.1 phosphotransferase [Gemmatimonadota bacterium]